MPRHRGSDVVGELPSGTVTFFFSDIEGSTQLVQRLGPDYPRVLANHAAIIRGTTGGMDATEIRTEGDSFFIVFRDAIEAVRAAGEIQRAMENHPWPPAGVVRVRIGVHTGSGELGGDDYVGLDVVRAARIGDAGHGGQIVVSSTTRELTSAALDGFEFVDLGSHHLKGLDEPERLHQATPQGLPRTFPPLRTRRLRRHNLPVQLTALLGRDTEAAAVADLLQSNRLVTLLGPGGVGKTRLALRVAADVVDRFSGGVWFVELAPIADDDLLAPEIAGVLGAPEGTVDAIAAQLGNEPVLVVLDNLEQLPGAAGTIASLLGPIDGLSVLATSQVPVRVPGERIVPVPTLAAGGNGSGSPAVDLFAERASAVNPSFELEDHRHDVVELVAALDGLPLAIELAAARTNLLTPAEIRSRLDADYGLLTSPTGSAGRHRSIEAAMAWSFDLLDGTAQAALARLGAFRGGASLEAAEAVLAGGPVADPLTTIGELVDRSLIVRDTSAATPRLRVLEPVRRFVADHRASDEEAGRGTTAHTRYFTELAARAEPELQGVHAARWLAMLDDDLDNLRVTLERLIDAGAALPALGMLGSLWRFYQGKGLFSEMRLWLDRVFALPGAAEPSIERAQGLMALGAYEYWRERADRAIGLYEEAVALARDHGDDADLGAALFGLATSIIISRSPDSADAHLDEAEEIYRALDDPGGLADVVGARVFNTLATENPSAAREGVEELVRLYTAAGRLTYAAHAKLAVGAVAIHEERYDDARAIALESLTEGQSLGEIFVQLWSIEWLAVTEVEQGRAEAGAVLAGAAERQRDVSGAGWTPNVYDVEDARSRLRRTLPADVGEAMLQLGRSISFADAVRLARHEAAVSDFAGT